MPTPAPSGFVSVALASLRTLLANCQAFQAFAGAADASAALAKVYYREGRNTSQWPGAVVGRAADLPLGDIRIVGTGGTAEVDFVIGFKLVGLIDGTVDLTDEAQISNFSNKAEAVMREMVLLRDTYGLGLANRFQMGPVEMVSEDSESGTFITLEQHNAVFIEGSTL